MKQSQLFTKTKKEVPADEVSKNAELLIRAGFIYKEMAGVYVYLPMGLRVLNKIIQIIREEMNAIGGQELSMTALQRPELWRSHFNQDRWDDKNVDIWFKTKLKDGSEAGLGFTHEEPISNMLEQFVSSYRDLPFSVYQFQTKFRNETRAKSGIMRTREFIMKDLYSFSKDKEEHDTFYRNATQAYEKIFQRVGLGDKTYLTFASGGVFAEFSHEFQTITDAGEDIIYVLKDQTKMNFAVNKEVYTDEVLKKLNYSRGDFIEKKAVEVGNIFTLGTKFSDPHLTYTDEKGQKQTVFMGSYGIGPGRLMGTIVETLADGKGIIWPEEVAPFRVHLLLLGDKPETRKAANDLYLELMSNKIEVFFDDREQISAGEKFADADLLGMPYRVVVSERSLKEGGFEIKKRSEETFVIMAQSQLLAALG